MRIFVMPQLRDLNENNVGKSWSLPGSLVAYLLAVILSGKYGVNMVNFVYTICPPEPRPDSTKRMAMLKAKLHDTFCHICPAETLEQVLKADKNGDSVDSFTKRRVLSATEIIIRTAMDYADRKNPGAHVILGGLDIKTVNALYARFVQELNPKDRPTKECKGFVLTFDGTTLKNVDRFNKPTWLYLLEIFSK